MRIWRFLQYEGCMHTHEENTACSEWKYTFQRNSKGNREGKSARGRGVGPLLLLFFFCGCCCCCCFFVVFCCCCCFLLLFFVVVSSIQDAEGWLLKCWQVHLQLPGAIRSKDHQKLKAIHGSISHVTFAGTVSACQAQKSQAAHFKGEMAQKYTFTWFTCHVRGKIYRYLQEARSSTPLEKTTNKWISREISSLARGH